MATIQKRTAGKVSSYRVMIRLKGYPAESATFDRLTDAREWANKTETAMKEGRHFGTSKRHTLADLLDRYEADRTARGRIGTSTKSTLKAWRELWGHELLSAITPERLNDERDRFKNAPAAHAVRSGKARKAAESYQTRERADGTVNRHMRGLSAVLGFGVKLGWLAANPSTRTIKLSEPAGRVRFLDDDELARFMLAVKASGNQDLMLYVVLSLTTGGRMSEILSLRWPQIDLKRRVITLGKTKNGDPRALPISGDALPILKERAKVRQLLDDRLFPPTERALKAQHMNITRPFEAAVKAAGITNFRRHDMRHCAASYLVMAGVDLVSVARILGHRQIQMTLRYSHLASERVVELGDKLAGKLAGLS
jgi:integrase